MCGDHRGLTKHAQTGRTQAGRERWLWEPEIAGMQDYAHTERRKEIVGQSSDERSRSMNTFGPREMVDAELDAFASLSARKEHSTAINRTAGPSSPTPSHQRKRHRQKARVEGLPRPLADPQRNPLPSSPFRPFPHPSPSPGYCFG